MQILNGHPVRKVFKSTFNLRFMRTGRKITGGKYHRAKKRKLYEAKGQTRIVKLGKEKTKKIRVRGGSNKIFTLSSEFANVYSKRTKKSKRAKIKNVLETPSNRFLARQNILLKGALIETEIGKAKITNRPSQEGNIQAVLVE
jgi:small subunit ribosomal protein S8e